MESANKWLSKFVLIVNVQNNFLNSKKIRVDMMGLKYIVSHVGVLEVVRIGKQIHTFIVIVPMRGKLKIKSVLERKAENIN
jgi:hypothetical protein